MKQKFTFVHLRGDSGRKFSVGKNRFTNVRNKWIKKENWLIKKSQPEIEQKYI